jgi:hypothetical protein
MLSLHLPHPFFFYLINPCSSVGKRWNLQCQWSWQQQRHESTTSRLVVGHSKLAFRNLGENATSQIIYATHRRKTRSRKTKNGVSKTLGKQTKKQRDTPRVLQAGYKEHKEQPLSKMSHTHRDLFGFVPPPSLRRIPSL